MTPNNRRPWLFILLTALILLTGGTAVSLAARMVAAPQVGKTVEAEAAPQFYGINDELFYPWNAYAPEDMAQLGPWSQGPDQAWYEINLKDIPEYLGFTGMEQSLTQGRTGEEVGFWMDCLVTAANGQPAMLDVAYAHQNGQFGMSWVGRSTGSLPTQAQKESAIAQVQWDVCAWLGCLDPSMLEDCITYLDRYMRYGSHSWPTQREEQASAVLSSILAPVKYIEDITTSSANGIDPTNFQDICQVAASQGLHIQLASTQRQVVLVLSPTTQGTGSPYLLGIYYDMVLQQYSGVAINEREGLGT